MLVMLQFCFLILVVALQSFKKMSLLEEKYTKVFILGRATGWQFNLKWLFKKQKRFVLCLQKFCKCEVVLKREGKKRTQMYDLELKNPD